MKVHILVNIKVCCIASSMLTGMGILLSSLPIQFFMMLHRFRL